MPGEEVKKLISLALAGGQITKQQFLTIQTELGLNKAEIERMLNVRFDQLTSTENTLKTNDIKCPGCGNFITGLSKVCPSCGYVININNELTNEVRKLEDAIIELKAIPAPNAVNTFIKILLCCGSAGIYIVYKKLYKKEYIFNTNNQAFNVAVAKVDLEERMLKNTYGEDSAVKKIIEEREKEKNGIIASRKKLIRTGKGITIAFFSYFILVNIFKSESPYSKTYKLLADDKIEEAKTYVTTLKDDNTKDLLEQRIKKAEVMRYIKQQNFAEANTVLNTMMDSDTGKVRLRNLVTQNLVNQLLGEKNIQEAKLVIARLNDNDTSKARWEAMLTMQEIKLLFEKGQLQDAKFKINVLKDDSLKTNLQGWIIAINAATLTNAGKFDEALAMTNTIEDTSVKKNAREKILSKQVEGLIAAKKFSKARLRLDLMNGGSERERLYNKINLEEGISR